jgi:vacuolar-type H+-ATPase subunit E/Vma4
MDGGELDVLLREEDRPLPLDLSVLAQTIGEKTGTETELKISNDRIDSLGGCFVRSRDGRIMIDNTFPAILKRRERTLRQAIRQILFPE